MLNTFSYTFLVIGMSSLEKIICKSFAYLKIRLFGFAFFFFKAFKNIYLAALDLSCNTQDLRYARCFSVVHGLSSCGAQAQECKGTVAPLHVGS